MPCVAPSTSFSAAAQPSATARRCNNSPLHCSSTPTTRGAPATLHNKPSAQPASALHPTQPNRNATNADQTPARWGAATKSRAACAARGGGWSSGELQTIGSTPREWRSDAPGVRSELPSNRHCVKRPLVRGGGGGEPIFTCFGGRRGKHSVLSKHGTVDACDK